MKQAIASPNGPQAVGPYSPAIRAGQLLFVSGQIPLDPATGLMVEGDTATQAHRVLNNIGALLGAAHLSFSHVVRTTIFLVDMDDFAAVNEVYGTYFPLSAGPAPARTTVQVARLPKNARIEIDVIASF